MFIAPFPRQTAKVGPSKCKMAGSRTNSTFLSSSPVLPRVNEWIKRPNESMLDHTHIWTMPIKKTIFHFVFAISHHPESLACLLILPCKSKQCNFSILLSSYVFSPVGPHWRCLYPWQRVPSSSLTRWWRRRGTRGTWPAASGTGWQEEAGWLYLVVSLYLGMKGLSMVRSLDTVYHTHHSMDSTVPGCIW